MSAQAIHDGKVFDLLPYLQTCAQDGHDVALLWRRGRWMAVNRAVTHCADLPLREPIIGAPADLNAPPWRVRRWEVLDEAERLDVLLSVSRCECVRSGHLAVTAHCAFCAGTAKPEPIEGRNGDLIHWRAEGTLADRYRLRVSGRGAMRSVHAEQLREGPGLFDPKGAPPILVARFQCALVYVEGEPYRLSRRVGGGLTCASLRSIRTSTPPPASRPRRDRRWQDGYGERV